MYHIMCRFPDHEFPVIIRLYLRFKLWFFRCEMFTFTCKHANSTFIILKASPQSIWFFAIEIISFRVCVKLLQLDYYSIIFSRKYIVQFLAGRTLADLEKGYIPDISQALDPVKGLSETEWIHTLLGQSPSLSSSNCQILSIVQYIVSLVKCLDCTYRRICDCRRISAKPDHTRLKWADLSLKDLIFNFWF